MGKTKIAERIGNTHSKRAKKGSLETIPSKCPHCGHHKAFFTMNKGRKCTRCKERY